MAPCSSGLLWVIRGAAWDGRPLEPGTTDDGENTERESGP